jgi:hypothetical protein
MRFQPLAAPGKAAALRGAMNRFRRSTVIADYMNQDIDITSPPQKNCVDQFRQRDQANTLPDFASVGGPKPGWTDTLLETFIDGSTQYTVLIPETVQAMQASAEFQIRGRASDLDEVETQWNGAYDSATAIGKFLAFGDDAPVPQPDFQGGHYVMAESGGTLAMGPKGAPTCPPVPSTVGGSAALTWSKLLKISPEVLKSPNVPSNTTYATALAWAYNEDLYNQKFITTPYDTATVLKRINSSLTDVQAAGDYLTALEKKNGTKVTYDNDTPSLPSGFHHVPRLISEPKPPATGVIKAAFLGSQTQSVNVAPSSKGYSQHGVISAVDQIKMTGQMFQLATVNATYVKGPIKDSIVAVVDEAKVFVGSQRVEFLFGVQPLNATDTMDQVRVYVHGVPAQSEEKYAVVLGLDGAKCVSTGTIDQAACNPADYLVELPAPGPLDGRMSDLTGGTIVKDLATMKLPNNASAPIPVPGWIFLLRQKNKSSPWTVLTGAETGAAPNNQFIDVQGFTRRIFAPIAAEGVSSLDQIMESSQLASVDDCSRPQDSCAGLPVTMFPPLESEVNGDQSSLPYERSWKKYLDEARQAADTADQLGREVVQAGLAMDQRREAAIEELRNLCGADADEKTGCGLDPKDNKTVTLGDAPVCLWATKGQMCKCQDPSGNAVACTGALRNCALVLRPELSFPPTDNGCRAYLTSIAGGQNVETVTAVTDALKLAQAQPRPAATVERTCSVFEELRTGNLKSYSSNGNTASLPDTSTNREALIRERLMPAWNRPTVSAIASGMRYREDFLDNYELTQDGALVFRTRRPSTQATNNETTAPCNPSPLDATTGAAFWTRKTSCYVSGLACPPSGIGVGADGCPNSPINGDFSKLSLDTEPAALRARWTWGFGHLRRSVATLGVLTGQLDGMMALAQPWGGPFFDQGGFPALGPVVLDRQPAWINHGTPSGLADLRPYTQCIALGDGLAGPGADTYREFSGRPVNWNGWLSSPSTNVSFGAQTIPSFPCVDPDGVGLETCAPSGLDPQMPYCAFTMTPGPAGTTRYYANLGASQTQVVDLGLNSTYFSPYVATSRTIVARFNGLAPWSIAQSDIWEIPPAGFCEDPYDSTRHGAVWKAFCKVPETIDEGAPAFVHEGLAQTTPPVYASRADVRGWVDAPADGSAAALFGVSFGSALGKKDFQYALDRRNIYDALELACHAYDRPKTESVDCASALIKGYTPKSPAEYVEALRCIAAQVRSAIGAYVVSDIPQAVVDAKTKSNGILAPGTGNGGALYDEMSNELSALSAIAEDYDHVQDALNRLASIEDEINSIEREGKGLNDQFLAQKRAAVAQAVAQAAQIMLSASSGNPAAAAPSSVAIAALTAATAFEQEALDAAKNVAQEVNTQKRINAFQRAYDQLAFARDSAKALSSHLNALSTASKRVRLIVQKGNVAVNKAKFADYAGNDQTDPQYVNIVMRRTYNTALVRYLRALDRAKKAAFIARRAVELRFGVDLQRMTSPLKLVDAPSTWATRVCTMGGIDYSKIRAPDGESSVSGFDFGAPPLQGDDYASSFIGDYVSLLEDFVKSYPIDFPLKDGDDTAVISLRDDILRTSTACTAPSRNALFYSSEIDKRDETRATPSTKGWFTRACSTSGGPEFPTGTEWTGCVQSYVMGPPALAPDANGQGQGTANDSVSLNGLPAGAIPYRFTSVPCVSGGNVVCPPQTTTTAVGVLAQTLQDIQPGYYVATVYAHLAPLSQPYANGNSAQFRIVRRSDGAVVAFKNFAPVGSDWEREELVFAASAQETYRLELTPSAQAAAISAPGEIAVWLAAPQVERLTTSISTTTPNATRWQRTDVLRSVPSDTCDDPTGVGLRTRFTRKCSYVCKGGIKNDCGNLSADGVPSACYYEAQFAIPLEKIESGALIPSGQIAIGNFNFRHNELGLNVTGTGVTNCDGIPQNSCYDNGFIQYTLIHNGDVLIRNWTGASLPAHMDTAFIEHGKALAAERVITNPPSGNDLGLMSPYMKGEYKGRPLEGLYTLRIYDSPSLRWDRVRDIQLVAKYHYWTRFSK